MADEFDKISSSFEEEGENDTPEFNTLNDVLEFYWKKFYPGSIPTQTLIIAEAAYPQGRILRYLTDGTEWATLGMIEVVRQNIQASNVAEILDFQVSEDEDSDDDDE